MDLHVPIADDLTSVLDKSIVVESRAQAGLQGIDLMMADVHASVSSSAVYTGYGRQGSWQEGSDAEELFPFWRRDLWTK